MAISPLPTPPSRSDPQNFAPRGDAFMAALPAFAAEANELQVDVNAKQVIVSEAATTASEQAGIATTMAGEAASSESSANDSKVAAAAYELSAFNHKNEAADSAVAAATSAATVDAQGFATGYAGASEPPVMWPYMYWSDTGTGRRRQRTADNTGWVDLGPLLDYHYTRGNILGTVSVDPGVVPTGALFQSGATSSGWVKIDADGGVFAHRLVTWPAGSSGSSVAGGIGVSMLPGWVLYAQARGILSGSYGGSYVVESNPVGTDSFIVKLSSHQPTTIMAAGAIEISMFAHGRVF